MESFKLVSQSAQLLHYALYYLHCMYPRSYVYSADHVT